MTHVLVSVIVNVRSLGFFSNIVGYLRHHISFNMALFVIHWSESSNIVTRVKITCWACFLSLIFNLSGWWFVPKLLLTSTSLDLICIKKANNWALFKVISALIRQRWCNTWYLRLWPIIKMVSLLGLRSGQIYSFLNNTLRFYFLL